MRRWESQIMEAAPNAETRWSRTSGTHKSCDDGAVADPSMPLAAGWDAHAVEWIAWARTGRDSYETVHRDAFLPLVPAPGRLTVDVGCGEGRVSRDLRALGHRMLAFDRSPPMCVA